MPLFVLLWLALLGVVPAPATAVRAVAPVPVRAERHPEPEAIRAPATVRLAAARPAGQLTPVAPERHAPPFALAAAAGRRDVAGAAARSTLARQLSHGVVARGGLLPYYPTAPPLQG